MELRPVYPVRSPRLLLRPLTLADVDSLVAYRSLPDVCRWVPFAPMSPDDVAQRIEGVWAATALDGEGQALILGVELIATGQVVGDVMLAWRSAEHRSGEVGYVFNPEFGGNGYATEAVESLLRLAFDGLGLHRIVARIDARNRRSADVARRVGMRQEAHLIENEWFKGEWTDEVDFALLAEEWSAQHRSTA